MPACVRGRHAPYHPWGRRQGVYACVAAAALLPQRPCRLPQRPRSAYARVRTQTLQNKRANALVASPRNGSPPRW